MAEEEGGEEKGTGELMDDKRPVDDGSCGCLLLYSLLWVFGIVILVGFVKFLWRVM